MTETTDERFMREALKEAQRALASTDQPVGAVIVHRAHGVARACHQVQLLRDPTAHATLIAVTQAASALSTEQLLDATIYVTREPCVMCVGALLIGGFSRLVIGAADPTRGACGSVIDLAGHERLNHRLIVVKGVLAEACVAVLRQATESIEVS